MSALCLDEVSEERLLEEINLRRRRRANDQCDYCGRTPDTSPCRFPERHRRSPGPSPVDTWVRHLLQRAGIRVVPMQSGESIVDGLLGVPAKYVTVIDSMKTALAALAEGGTLPEILPRKKKS